MVNQAFCSSKSTFPFRIYIRNLLDGQRHEMAAAHVLGFQMKDVAAPRDRGIVNHKW